MYSRRGFGGVGPFHIFARLPRAPDASLRFGQILGSSTAVDCVGRRFPVGMGNQYKGGYSGVCVQALLSSVACCRLVSCLTTCSPQGGSCLMPARYDLL